MADHVVHSPFPPLETDNHGVMLVASLEVVRANEHFDPVLVQDLDGVGGRLQPPHWGSILLLIEEA